MKTPSGAEFLSDCELFAGLDREALLRVESELGSLELRGGDVLFRQGERADCLYIVVEGRLRVLRETAGGETRAIAELGARAVVGELSLLTGEERSATVRAVRDTRLLKLEKPAFERLAENAPRASLAIARELAKRQLRSMSPDLAHAPAIIALAPSSDVALDEFSRLFEEALREISPEIRLTSSLEQADLVLHIADARQEPDPSAGQPADEHGARRELVLLHDTRRKRYEQTARWLATKRFSAHHHVDLDSPKDVRRLARLVSGKALGLVLGGGGARGLAHVGVIRALSEAGIEADAVAGTSMGAFIAAQYAQGKDWRSILQFSRYCWRRARPFLGNLRPVSLGFTGRKFIATARRLFGGLGVEDLRLPCLLVASNLTRAEVRVADEGALWFWVCASMAIPGMFPPLIRRGELFVDGGVLNNLPVDVLRASFGGRVIASDVSVREDLASDYGGAVSPPAWRLALNRLNPFSRRLRVPGFFEVLVRSASLASMRDAETVKKQADLCFHPPLDQFGMLDFERVSEIVEIGYEHARAQLAKADWPRAR